MEQRKKIDETLTERRGILDLLESLEQDEISLAELDEIGTRLQKSGKRAVSPLMRKLWREKSGNVISRYTYLLNFFDDGIWLDQLVQIAIARRDLEEDGKEALLDALEECGIDVSGPPFPSVQVRHGVSLRTVVPGLLDKGEEGLVCIIEDILFLSPEERLGLIRELPRLKDPRIPSLLEILAGIESPQVRQSAVEALGRVRSDKAVAILQGLEKDTDEQVRREAARSLRRLSFLGLVNGPSHPQPKLPPLQAAYISPFDGTGCRTLWLARQNGSETLAVLCLKMHETEGIISAWGSSEVTPAEFADYMDATGNDEGSVEVPPTYALTLIRDALAQEGREGEFLPAEFYVWRRHVGPEQLAATAYTPDFGGRDIQALGRSVRLIADSVSLFDDDLFAGWGLVTERAWDYAEEWSELEKTADGAGLAKGMEELLAKFCAELLLPELKKIRRRLLLTADLMRLAGREADLVDKTLAAAMSIEAPQFRHTMHPFLTRLALESMELAREALAEGYDARLTGVSGDVRE